jgi:hypothetical protein
MSRNEILITGRKRLGRPRLNQDKVRSKRIVTFVTNSEFVKLAHIAENERVSLSLAVHQILSGFLKDD